MAKGRKTGGRRKGSTNKLTGELKDMILQALSDAGGVGYLKKQAAETPTAFLSLVGKVLPLQVTGDNGTPLIPAGATLQFVATVIPDSENRT